MLEIYIERLLRYKEEDSGPPLTGSSSRSSDLPPTSERIVYGDPLIGIQWAPPEKKYGKKSKRFRESNILWTGTVYRSSYSGEGYSYPRESKKHNYSIDERDTSVGECDLGEIVRKTVKWICENT